MSLSRATDLATQLGQLDGMEDLLQSASSPAALSEIDLEQVRTTWVTTRHGRWTAWPS